MQQTGVQRWGFTLLSQPWFLGIWRVFPGPKVMLELVAPGPTEQPQLRGCRRGCPWWEVAGEALLVARSCSALGRFGEE